MLYLSEATKNMAEEKKKRHLRVIEQLTSFPSGWPEMGIPSVFIVALGKAKKQDFQ